jgi:hypothetical protein
VGVLPNIEFASIFRTFLIELLVIFSWLCFVIDFPSVHDESFCDSLLYCMDIYVCGGILSWFLFLDKNGTFSGFGWIDKQDQPFLYWYFASLLFSILVSFYFFEAYHLRSFVNRKLVIT